MVDQIYERDGQDVSLELSMTMGLGLENGTKVTQQIIKHNPRWTAATTRFEVWSDIVTMAHKKKIFVHPDLHVGKAMWCCSHEDGNAWFVDIRKLFPPPPPHSPISSRHPNHVRRKSEKKQN